jgi:hypothetical protein
MRLALVMRPKGPAPKGQENLAQGLPWVNSPTGIRPEGAGRYGGIGSESPDWIACTFAAPSGQNVYFG